MLRELASFGSCPKTASPKTARTALMNTGAGKSQKEFGEGSKKYRSEGAWKNMKGSRGVSGRLEDMGGARRS